MKQRCRRCAAPGVEAITASGIIAWYCERHYQAMTRRWNEANYHDMEKHAYRCVPVVIDEDEPLHTDATPFCCDLACPCHHDTAYFWQHADTPYLEGLITKAEQYRIFYGEHLVPRSEEGRP